MYSIWALIAVIMGVILYKDFDFETMRFGNTPIAIVYLITFFAAVFFLIKGRKQPAK